MNKQNAKFRRLWLTDILGFLKSFSITFEELEAGLELGSGFDGSFIQGFARIDESDMVALPGPNAFQLFPWRPKEHATARIFCDICWLGASLLKATQVCAEKKQKSC